MKGFIGLPFLLIVIVLSIIVILIGGWLMANAVIVAKTTFHISAESQDKGSLGLAILKSATNTTAYTEIFAGSLADNFNQEVFGPIKKQAAASDRKISIAVVGNKKVAITPAFEKQTIDTTFYDIPLPGGQKGKMEIDEYE